MIRRDITDELFILLDEYPVVTVLGPRQSGKTTLVRNVLTGYEYSNLEIPEVRQLAMEDPKAYLASFEKHVIIDEIQRVPELLSYIQAIVDEDDTTGRFVLTGSHQLRLSEVVSQSLAGRTAILNLYPFSIQELSKHGKEFDSFEAYCFRGFLPRIYDKSLRPGKAHSNYYRTYVERDVRMLINLKDLSLFERFLKLLAGRSGQLMEYSSLARDVGVSAKSIRSWLSILEASFIVFKLPPYFENFGKRIIKSPKYYFTDVGMLCFLLGIRKASQISRDPLVGQVFENLVVMECVKNRNNRGIMPDLYFYRDSNGNEVDILHQDGRSLTAVEVKCSSTFSHGAVKGLLRFKEKIPQVRHVRLVYNGDNIDLSDNVGAVHFKNVHRIFGV
jgi:uncharacterized protein